MRLCAIAPAAALLAAPAAAARPFTAHDLVRMERVSDPQPSPDGARVAFVVRETDVEADCGRTDVWLFATEGGAARRLTTHEANDHHPRWSSDGRSLFSRFLYFPDENHWVLRPGNSLRWHAEVLAWLDRWSGPGPGAGS